MQKDKGNRIGDNSNKIKKKKKKLGSRETSTN